MSVRIRPEAAATPFAQLKYQMRYPVGWRRKIEGWVWATARRVLQDYPRLRKTLRGAYTSVQELSQGHAARPSSHAAAGAKKFFECRARAVSVRVDADGSGGVFFKNKALLPAVPCLIRCQLQFGGKPYSDQAVLTFTVRHARSRKVCTRRVISVESVISAPDDVFIPVDILEAGLYEVRVHVSEQALRTHIRRIYGHAATARGQVNYFFDFGKSHYGKWPVRRLRNVVIGTTGVCNASCIHCPTNKTDWAHLERKPMEMALFSRIIDQISASWMPIDGLLTFGLYGDALMDPMVVERARYVRDKLPNVKLLINTNGAPFSERRHLALVDLADCFSVHIEAITPEVYEALMPPLKAAHAFQKIERLVELAGKKVNVCVPLCRPNVQEFSKLKTYWLARGVQKVIALPFSNRTTTSLSYYQLSLGPIPGSCRQWVASELIVDWDGKVVACCQDFGRGNVIGDLSKQTFKQTMTSPEGRELFERLAAGQWSHFRSCRDCTFDQAGIVADLARSGGHGL